jgi:serine/threonine protein kinase
MEGVGMPDHAGNRRRTAVGPEGEAGAGAARPAPGKCTFVEQAYGRDAPAQRSASSSSGPAAVEAKPEAARPAIQELFGSHVQRRAVDGDAGAQDTAAIHASAQRGIATSASPLPFADQIQRLFGRHDISGIQAHTGADAAASARDMGADAYATGNHVVLGKDIDLHTVAHEAAHVVQQRGGVQLKGGVGEVGDVYEQHADQAADHVVRGESAEAVLTAQVGQPSSGPSGAPGVQRRIDIRYYDRKQDGATADDVLAFLGSSDRQMHTTYRATVEADVALRGALDDLVAAERIETFGFLQAADLVTELRVMAKQAMRHDGKLYDVARPLREAADSVYHVRRDGEDSVIKRAGPGREDALGNEAALMQTVHGHPNVVGTHGASSDSTQIRMELVPNGMLKDHDVQDAAQSKQVAKGIISGLAHVHAHQVVHGDLDNKNVFMGGTQTAPVAKIADFGSGSSGPDAIQKKVAGDITGGVTMLRSLVQPYSADETALAFSNAVNQVGVDAQAINTETMANADPDADTLVALGMSLDEYWEMQGERPPAPTQERVQALIAAWAQLGLHPWLA